MIALLLAAVATGCRREAPSEPFIRLSGPAPSIAPGARQGAVLYAFWASWCAPCVEEAPTLRALAEDPPSGLTVVIISMDDTLAQAERTFGGGTARLVLGTRELASAFRVSALPTSVLASNGRLVARFEGARDWNASATRRTLERLVAPKPSAR